MKKMSTGVVVLIAVLAIIVIIGVSLVGGYNGIAAARENVDTQQAAIQTQLQRRADLIPNLVNTVKGLAAQEQSVIDSVTEARAQLAGAQGMGMEELAAANDNLS
ncbi:MAG: LemA family protein, partial [Anaerotruncus massiliensis (ex Togo et al. 2019)]